MTISCDAVADTASRSSATFLAASTQTFPTCLLAPAHAKPTCQATPSPTDRSSHFRSSQADKSRLIIPCRVDMPCHPHPSQADSSILARPGQAAATSLPTASRRHADMPYLPHPDSSARPRRAEPVPFTPVRTCPTCLPAPSRPRTSSTCPHRRRPPRLYPTSPPMSKPIHGDMSCLLKAVHACSTSPSYPSQVTPTSRASARLADYSRPPKPRRSHRSLPLPWGGLRPRADTKRR